MRKAKASQTLFLTKWRSHPMKHRMTAVLGLLLFNTASTMLAEDRGAGGQAEK